MDAERILWTDSPEKIKNIDYEFLYAKLTVNNNHLFVIGFEVFQQVNYKIYSKEIETIGQLIKFIESANQTTT